MNMIAVMFRRNGACYLNDCEMSVLKLNKQLLTSIPHLRITLDWLLDVANVWFRRGKRAI